MRTETEIMHDLLGVYDELSPENLAWDGERPQKVVDRERSRLQKRLKTLFKELGREVDALEVVRYLESC